MQFPPNTIFAVGLPTHVHPGLVDHLDALVGDLNDAGVPLGRLGRAQDLLDGLTKHGVALVEVGLHGTDVLEEVALLAVARPAVVGLGGVEVVVLDVHDVRQGEDADLARAEVGSWKRNQITLPVIDTLS